MAQRALEAQLNPLYRLLFLGMSSRGFTSLREVVPSLTKNNRAVRVGCGRVVHGWSLLV